MKFIPSLELPAGRAALLVAFSLVVSTCLAVPYDGNGPGESTIGTGGDYVSLYDACVAISSAPLTGGDWTFSILNDLWEPRDCSILQTASTSHTITLRPAPGVDATVTFTTTLSPTSSSPVGHLTVGAGRQLTGARLIVPTHFITIDGSNTVGGTTRNLAFKNTAGAGARTLLGVVGHCENVTIKNCNLDCYGVHASYGAVGYLYPVSAGIDFYPLSTGADTKFVPDYVQHNGRVENCHFRYFGNRAAAAVSMNVFAAFTGLPLDNRSRAFTCAGNVMTSFTVGLQALGYERLDVSDNVVNVDTSWVSGTAFTNCGLFAQPGVGTGASTNLLRNRITIDHRGNAGCMAGIMTREVVSKSNTLIENNMISGDFSLDRQYESTPFAFGIQSEAEAGSTVTLRHNSVALKGVMAPINKSAGFYMGTRPGFSQNPVGFAILRNNIIRAGMPGSVAVQSRGTSASLDSNYNCLFAAAAAYVGRCDPSPLSPNPETMQWWQEVSGQDVSSINLDPYTSAGEGLGTWTGPAGANDADLHFAAFPGGQYLAPAIAGVAGDLDGEPRGDSLALMGADEVADPGSRVNDWSMY